MRPIHLRSPLARAVVPVAAGIAFFGVIALILWGAAAYIAENNDEVSLAPSTYEAGRTKTFAEIIATDGPLILPDLLQASGRRTIVLDHTGDDPDDNWRIYMAYPADRDVDCKVTQIRGTRTFTDCEGRTIEAEALADPPAGVSPIVSRDGRLTLDLLPDSADEPTPTTD